MQAQVGRTSDMETRGYEVDVSGGWTRRLFGRITGKPSGRSNAPFLISDQVWAWGKTNGQRSSVVCSLIGEMPSIPKKC